MTELMIAARDGKRRVVISLVKRGVEVNARSKRNLWGCGRTALMYAAESGFTEICRQLLRAGADPSIQDGAWEPGKGGKTGLHYAARGGHTEVMSVLIAAGADVNAPDKDGMSPLMEACQGPHVDSIRLLLSSGASVNARTKSGATPLLFAVLELGGRERAIVRNMLVKRRTKPLQDIRCAVQLLLRAGAKPDTMDRECGTALMVASREGNVRIVRMLVEAGADPNLRGPFGQSALCRAVVYPGHPDVVFYLLEKGADVHVRDCEGLDVLETAKRSALKDGRRMASICQMLHAARARKITSMH